MKSYMAVMIGGAIGSLARYVLGWEVRDDPWTTLFINLTGCLILGFFLTYAAASKRISETMRLGFGTGVMGGYTTFSTFAVQVVTQGQSGTWSKMALYLFSSLVGGVLMAWLGTILARRAARKAVSSA